MANRTLIRQWVEDSLLSVPVEKWPYIDKYVEYIAKEFYSTGTIWNGYHFQAGFNREIAQYIYNEWEPKPGDIVVASYPKTGTNWTKEIIQQIVYRNNDDHLKWVQKIFPIFSHLANGPKDKFIAFEHMALPRRIFCTHIPAPLFNFDKFRRKGVKIVYVIRNPKDQAVSWYNFTMTFPYIDSKPWCDTMPRNEKLFYDLYLSGKQKVFAKEGEGYLEHVRGWYEHKNDANVMFLCYEDMKENTEFEIHKIAKHIEEDLTEKEAKSVVQNSDIDLMKKKFDEHKSSVGFFRKGEVGIWKDHLTVAQSELIDSKVEKLLRHTDIKFRYEL